MTSRCLGNDQNNMPSRRYGRRNRITLQTKYAFFALCNMLKAASFFFLNTQIPNFIKIRPFGAKLLYAVRYTDMTNVTVGFRNLANVPKNRVFCLYTVNCLTGGLRWHSG